MAIQNIHKQAILKLINSFTTYRTNRQQQHQQDNFFGSSNHHQQQQSIEFLLFKEPQTLIDLSAIPRLGFIISKFEQYFRPNSLLINANGDNNNNNDGVVLGIQQQQQQQQLKLNNQNVLYLQQINVLIEFIENNNLLRIKLENNDLETTTTTTIIQQQQQQSSQHVQMLILLIRDWMLQFYLDKSFIYELFPSTTTNGNDDEILI